MKLGREAMVGAVSALVVVGLIAWAWSWFVSKPGADTIAITMPSSMGTQTVPSSPLDVTGLPKPVDEWAAGWAAAGLPRATGHIGGPPKLVPDQPEPPLTPEQVVCPLFRSLTISSVRPDDCGKEDIVARSIEIFALMAFDVSRLPEVPKKAILRAHVSYIENTCGYRTPLRLVFYRLKADWDDSATFRYASSRDQVEWQTGSAFSHTSPANIDLNPVATVEIPNPCKPGFNIEADITSVVAAWRSGAYPNHGLLMYCDFGVGRSVQGNLASRKHSAVYTPQILCSVSAPPPATTQPVPQVERATVPTTVSDRIRNVITSK
jgi:hypothetical protein